jgi:histone acetyltransferase 1
MSDFDTDEEAFLTRVEEDAVLFKPTGKLIHSYTHPVPSTSEASSATPEQVEYEVYHVTVMSTFCHLSR